MKNKSWIDRSKVVRACMILAASLFLAVSLYVVIDCNADDAGTYRSLYWKDKLGSAHYSWKDYLQPWTLVAVILNTLGVGDTGAEMVMMCFAVWYFLCVAETLSLAMKDTKSGNWLILATVFILIPCAETNRFHLFSHFVSLLGVLALYYYKKTKRKIYLGLYIPVLVYFFLFSADRMILLMNVAMPIALYVVIWCIQKKEKRKYLYIGGVVLSLAVAVLKMANEICGIIRGYGFGFMEQWDGYGGAEYFYWTDVHTFFDKGIPSFFASLLVQFNIPIDGGIIQFQSFFWIIRIFLVILMLAAFISRWREIVQKGIDQVPIIDVCAVLGITVTVGVNILNGIILAFNVSGGPINRYAGFAWFLFVVLLIRWLDEKAAGAPAVKLGKREAPSGVALGVIAALLIVGYSEPIYLGRDAIVHGYCQAEIDYLKSFGGEYKYGLASYWKATPIMAQTNAEYIACTGWVTEDDLTRRSNPIYMDGSNYFNYIISDVQNSMTMSEENIERLRGDYIKKERLYESGESIIYLYDYDIRWEPQLKVEAVGTDYELTDPIAYYYDFPVGTSRIEMEVSNSGNFALGIAENEDVRETTVQLISDNKIYVDVTCSQNTSVTFNVGREADELTTIHKITLKRVRGSVPVYDAQTALDMDEMFLKSGSYVFTFEGDNLKNLAVEWEGDNISVSRLTDGEIKRRFLVTVDSPQVIRFAVSGSDLQLSRISYENAELFPEKEQQ